MTVVLIVVAVAVTLFGFAWLEAGSGQGGCAHGDEGVGGRADD